MIFQFFVEPEGQKLAGADNESIHEVLLHSSTSSSSSTLDT